MAQGEIIDVKPGEYGTVVTIENLDGTEKSYVYNGNLNLEQLEKLKGMHISYGESKDPKSTQLNYIFKAWDKERVVYSEIPFDGDDRSSR